MEKKELRNIIRAGKRQFTHDDLRRLSLPVIERLMAHPRFVAARTVMLYHSLADEVDTRLLLNTVSDKRVLLPKVTGEGIMELRVYTGPDDLSIGAYGIMEPAGCLFTDYSAVDLAVVPGMAFDKSGNRLGRGKGYYDRLLPLIGYKYKIGICFPFQLLDSIPVEPTDVPVDEVIC